MAGALPVIPNPSSQPPWVAGEGGLATSRSWPGWAGAHVSERISSLRNAQNRRAFCWLAGDARRCRLVHHDGPICLVRLRDEEQRHGHNRDVQLGRARRSGWPWLASPPVEVVLGSDLLRIGRGTAVAAVSHRRPEQTAIRAGASNTHSRPL